MNENFVQQFYQKENQLVTGMQKYGIDILRVALGIVFLWFGALKLIGASPVKEMIALTYPFFPQQTFLIVLGVWEAAIGLGLIFKIAPRTTILLLWLQMTGTIFATILSPGLFFQHMNPLLLTKDGEFVAKNLILIAASIAVGGKIIKTRK